MKSILDANIMLEGCDCTGKSSIAEELAKQNPGLRVMHYANPKGFDDGQKQYRCLVDTLRCEKGIVLDRGALGECVYGPLFRGYYPEYMRELELLMPDNTYLFLVHADERVVRSRFDGKFITRDQIPGIIDDFKREFGKSNYSHKHLLPTDTGMTPAQLAVLVRTIVETTMRLEDDDNV
jgi:thymidylate kinase